MLHGWGFDGLVMSDWFGLWDAKKALLSGLHLEMPGHKVPLPLPVHAPLPSPRSPRTFFGHF